MLCTKKLNTLVKNHLSVYIDSKKFNEWAIGDVY